MTRLNMGLVLAIVVSAFYLVHTQYESRRLVTAIDRAQSQAARLDADHEQLKVQKRAQATPARVQQVANARLDMRPANPAITQYVAPPASPMSAAPAEVRP